MKAVQEFSGSNSNLSWQRTNFCTVDEIKKVPISACDTIEHVQSCYEALNQVKYIDATRFSGKTIKTDKILAQMQYEHKIYSCGESLSALYNQTDIYGKHFHPFSNESGLPKTLARCHITHGASVGVSGSIFDVGSIGCDAIISIDSNPAIAQTILVFSAVLLHVDDLSNQYGFDEQRRADEVLKRLSYHHESKERQKIIDELQQLLPYAEFRTKLPELMNALWSKRIDAPNGIWCKGEQPVERIAHLTKLARQGRIIAITGDIAAVKVVHCINSVLKELRTSVSVIHLTNVLDYTPNIAGICNLLSNITGSGNAMLTTTTDKLGSMFRRTDSKGAPLVANELGSFSVPAVLSGDEWLGPHGKGQILHEQVWNDENKRKVFWKEAVLRLTCGVVEVDIHNPPADFQAFTNELLRLENKIFNSPKLARERLRRYLENLPQAAQYKEIGGDDWFTLVSIPFPTCYADLPILAARFDRAFKHCQQ